MTTIPVQLNDMDIQKIDALIKRGSYKNRSQAIRVIIREKLEQESLRFEWEKPQDTELQAKVLKELLQSKTGPVFTWKSSKTAAELIREDRDR